MKFLAVFVGLVAVAAADVSHILAGGDPHYHHHHDHHEHDHYHPGSEATAAIVKSVLDNTGSGSYSFGYDTQNGIHAEETGTLRRASSPNTEDSVAAQGVYSWTAPDGQAYTVNYVADENGYQPSGAHLPVAPEIPQAILRSLEYNAAHPEQN